MALSRLSLRRATFGPRHDLVAPRSEDTRPLSRGLGADVKDALADARTEDQLRAAAKSVVLSAMTMHDHRRFIEDLDYIWPNTRACRNIGSEDVVTMTIALRDALCDELREVSDRPWRPWREILALFNFIAELCWANYISPSEHVIQRALGAMLGNDGCKRDMGRRIEICAYFLSRVGEILSRSPLELFTALDPKVARLATMTSVQPPRTAWFVWVLMERMTHGWIGSVFLDEADGYWEDWALARLLLLGGRKEEPDFCVLATLPVSACDLIAACLCARSRWDNAIVVWDRTGGDQLRFSSWTGKPAELPLHIQRRHAMAACTFSTAHPSVSVRSGSETESDGDSPEVSD